MDDVVIGLGLLDQISSVRDGVMDSGRVVLAEVKVLLSKLVNCRVNLNNSSINAMLDESRRCGSDTKTTMLG